MSNKKFEVKIKEEFGRPALSVTNNGYQWTSIIIQDAEYEIPLIIKALQRYLSPNKIDTPDPYFDKDVECGRCGGNHFDFEHPLK